jgi:hypothetical protein
MDAQALAEAAQAQQAQQAAIVSLLEGPVDKAVALLNPQDPSSLDEFIVAMIALTRNFGRVSALRAAQFYNALRASEGVKGSFKAKTPPPVAAAKVIASMRWATAPLWQGSPDIATVRDVVLGVTEKNVLDMGRETILGSIKADTRAKGWAREVEPGCCSFCAMLATRGAVYRSEETASFESHNSCRCFAVPVFTAYEPTAQVREWQQLYKESTKGVRGSAAARNAFRRAFEAKSTPK